MVVGLFLEKSTTRWWVKSVTNIVCVLSNLLISLHSTCRRARRRTVWPSRSVEGRRWRVRGACSSQPARGTTVCFGQREAPARLGAEVRAQRWSGRPARVRDVTPRPACAWCGRLLRPARGAATARDWGRVRAARRPGAAHGGFDGRSSKARPTCPIRSSVRTVVTREFLHLLIFISNLVAAVVLWIFCVNEIELLFCKSCMNDLYELDITCVGRTFYEQIELVFD
jgi:hypothetical protein